MKKIRKKLIIMFCIMALMIPVFNVQAGTNTPAAKSVTRTYTPLHGESVFKALSIYGKDTFVIKYNGQKVISCQASQSKKDLGSDMFEKGGIRLTKKTSSAWTYTATWYMNFNILPKAFQKAAAALKMPIASLSRLGRVCTVTVTYTVKKDGTISHKYTYKFQCPSSIKSKVEKVTKFLTEAF